MIDIKADEFVGERIENWPFEGQKLSKISFEKCEFIKCNLIGFAFEKCKFDECTFVNCMFSAVEFNSCEMLDIKVKNSKMIGIDWTKTKDITRIQFRDTVLDMSNFGFLKLKKSKFVDCSVKDCDFTNTDLSGDDLSGCDFENTRFIQTNLSGTNLTRAKNYMINIFGNTVTKAKFSMPEVVDLLKGLDIIVE